MVTTWALSKSVRSVRFLDRESAVVYILVEKLLFFALDVLLTLFEYILDLLDEFLSFSAICY